MPPQVPSPDGEQVGGHLRWMINLTEVGLAFGRSAFQQKLSTGDTVLEVMCEVEMWSSTEFPLSRRWVLPGRRK
ncbi:MAG: hypothetical protein NZM29_03920 [Nitrospira sp.]|nr:hypothetical protein [Nitrospira sp.]